MKAQIFTIEIQGDEKTRWPSCDNQAQLATWIEHLVQSRVDEWTAGSIPKVTVCAAQRVSFNASSGEASFSLTGGKQ